MTFRATAGTLTSAAAGDAFQLTEQPKSNDPGRINVTVWGTFSATVQIERSFDGSTWHAVSKDVDGTAASYTAGFSLVVAEPELGVRYRINCTAFTSGTINYRISA